MTDMTLDDEIDRLDTGISEYPDVAGIDSAARRRRRCTRAIMDRRRPRTAAAVAPLRSSSAAVPRPLRPRQVRSGAVG